MGKAVGPARTHIHTGDCGILCPASTHFLCVASGILPNSPCINQHPRLRARIDPISMPTRGPLVTPSSPIPHSSRCSAPCVFLHRMVQSSTWVASANSKVSARRWSVDESWIGQELGVSWAASKDMVRVLIKVSAPHALQTTVYAFYLADNSSTMEDDERMRSKDGKDSAKTRIDQVTSRDSPHAVPGPGHSR